MLKHAMPHKFVCNAGNTTTERVKGADTTLLHWFTVVSLTTFFFIFKHWSH